MLLLFHLVFLDSMIASLSASDTKIDKYWASVRTINRPNHAGFPVALLTK